MMTRMLKKYMILFLFFLIISTSLSLINKNNDEEEQEIENIIRKNRNNQWIPGIQDTPLYSDEITPSASVVTLHQDDVYKYKILSDEMLPDLPIPQYDATTSMTTTPTTIISRNNNKNDDNTNSLEAPANNEMGMGSSKSSNEGLVKYEEVQELLEHFLNSKLDLNNNLDVITQAFRFVKLDSHLGTLLHQIRKLEKSQDSLQRMTTTHETKFDLMMKQITELVNSINSESIKLRLIEEKLESEIGTMNHRLESAVEKIITSSTTSQIMLDLSKESLQQMDKMEGTSNEVLNVLKTLKTELGDVGQASIQVIYNVQKSEETLMRAIAESGNRTIYALRQEPSSPSLLSSSSSSSSISKISTASTISPSTTSTTTTTATSPAAAAASSTLTSLGNGRRGNFIQADASTNKVDNDKVDEDDDDDVEDGPRPSRSDDRKEAQGLRAVPYKKKSTKKSYVSCLSRKILINGQPKDCTEIQLSGYSRSGIYKIYPFENTTQIVEVYCDLESMGGGWTVIQRRVDHQFPRENFFRTWQEYEKGFGSSHSHLWLGLSVISALTSFGDQTLNVELKDWDGLTKVANYGYFRVDNSSQLYKLHVADFTGSAGDSLAYHNGMAFSTKDKDNDLEKSLSCANRYHGGWWYKNCHQSNLNGMYFERKGRQETYATGINWYTWHGYYYSLKMTQMKIRPRHFDMYYNNN